MRHQIVSIFAAGLILCGCAGVQPAGEVYDPLEPVNRVTNGFNMAMNTYVFRPFIKCYRTVTPDFFRTGVDNFSHNLRQPEIMLNAFLQGDLDAGAHSLGRFFINSTVGIGGLFDVATKLDIDAPKKDFGQTLYTWGLKDDGAYLVLPLIGPSNVRDTAGMSIGFFADPMYWALPKRERHLLWWRYGIQTLSSIDNSTDLLYNVEQTSADPYAALRSMFQQNRQKFLTGDDATSESYDFDFPDFDEE